MMELLVTDFFISSIIKKAGATPRTNIAWAENGLRAALRRRTWGC